MLAPGHWSQTRPPTVLNTVGGPVWDHCPRTNTGDRTVSDTLLNTVGGPVWDRCPAARTDHRNLSKAIRTSVSYGFAQVAVVRPGRGAVVPNRAAHRFK